VCRLEPGTGAVTHVRLVAAGAGPAPQRLSEAENLLQGNHLSTEVISAAADAAASEVDPPADINADAGYRRRLVSVLVKQALEEIRSEH
jgi:carbon-monoxide dehydrogenase medium subunit